MRGLILVIACFLGLGACSSLPGSAPLEREILDAAEGSEIDFAVYPVTRSFLPFVAEWPVVGEPVLAWGVADGGARTQVIASGDQIEVTIWDSTEASLLSAEGERSVRIEALTVQPDGTIFLPYVGDAEVLGMTPQVARAVLQDRITEVVPSAQVQVQITSGRANSVDIVGGVAAPGSYPLPDRSYSVLNLIAQSGGVRETLVNPQLRLIRGGQIYGTSLDRLFETPELDMRLRGGDRVIIEQDDRYFLSLGAAGSQNQHVFPSDHVSALDAVSIIGGVESGRGDPGGVLILREYPIGAMGPDQPRVVFTLDLTSTDGLFSARSFRINAGDLVLVTESPITRAQTILGLIGSAFGVASQTARLRD